MRILLFGATGSAGGSVLQACLETPRVTEIRAVARRPLPVSDPRLRVHVHRDYEDYSAVRDAFRGVDACLFCLGKSVRQTSGEAEYREITYAYPTAAARMLREQSPEAVFHYLSGAGAGLDSRWMWARVKAEAERDLMAEFGAVCWRPASIDGAPSESEPPLYRVMRPVMRLFSPFPGIYVKGEDIGRAMLQATAEGIRSRIIENPEIRRRAAAWRAAPG